MPIFPRRRHIGTSAVVAGELTDFKNLFDSSSANLAPVDVADFDDDIPRQNLLLVGGWRELLLQPIPP